MKENTDSMSYKIQFETWIPLYSKRNNTLYKMEESYNDLIMNIKINFDGKWKMKSNWKYKSVRLNYFIVSCLFSSVIK